jgi:serine/threonine-protein kinase
LTSTATRSQDDEVLRQRLVLFGLVGGALGLLALLLRTPALVLHGHSLTSYFWHAAGAVLLLGIAPLCRFFGSTRPSLKTIDALALPLSALCYGLMGRNIAPADPGMRLAAQLTVLLAVSYGAFARATYVPSSGRWTFIVTAACFPGLAVASSGASGDPTLIGGSLAGALMWWTIATIAATLVSNVIYGLRREMRAARQYGQYMLEEKIGEGGMGVVYRASHAMLRRPTALKLLQPSRVGRTSVARFEKEVRLTARLKHPHTVTIFDYGRTPDGVFYYAMELLDGETLEDIVSTTGPMPAARVVRVARQVAGALAEAHELGLVHRDVKPANIMLCASVGGEADVAKVLDFGLVRDQNADLGATGTTFVGTPLYMSPEAITDPTTVSDASDIYALGAVLYFVLAGVTVFEAPTTIEICASHLHHAPVPPSARTKNPIPQELESLVLACLAKAPQDRPRSARELARMLGQIEKSLSSDAWEQDAVASWWDEHRDVIARHRKERTPKTLSQATSRTLAIDFVRR